MSVIDIGAARRRTRPAAANSVRLTAAPAHGSTATDFSKSIIGTKSNLEHEPETTDVVITLGFRH